MRRLYKVVAAVLAAVMLMTSLMAAGGAITVEKDGNKYILASHTPTTGDVNVLMIRIGFADYSVDDEDDPADSEQTLLSYFDGSASSVNGFYETSSYGKLRLHCDKVYSYNADYERDEYDSRNPNASYSVEALMEETFNALEPVLDLDDYDSDGDGYLDFVVFDYAGPNGDWGTTWWPHVNRAVDFQIGDKRIYSYSFLKGKMSTMIHEFGHILGATDYYSTGGSHDNVIMTYDMMSIDIGDHDGFTKWSYGWLDDDDITYVDRAQGDTTVALTPIESYDDGKKIAVVAPTLDRTNGFLNEYFLVEYDSGVKNNAGVFEEYGLEPGFRIFHVNAACTFIEGETYISYSKTNVLMRDNLIHNMKNEDRRDVYWREEDLFFREGDSLTPEGYPNTGLSADDMYNGGYTGISFTDFVTGDNPSFKVSFSDAPAPDVQVELSVEYDELKSDAKITVKADKPLTARDVISVQETERYMPYLIDDNGVKLTLYAELDLNDPFTCEISYRNASPTVQPDTEYTLVIPQGFFKTGYQQEVPEFRQKVRSADFLPLEVISRSRNREMTTIQTGLFDVTDSTYGVISVPRRDASAEYTFAEYNLDGEEIAESTFDIPSYDRGEHYIYKMRAQKLNDGNFALIFDTDRETDFVKIDRRGNVLSDVYAYDNELVSDFVNSPTMIEYDLYKNGLCKALETEENTITMLTVDFESAPKMTAYDHSFYYYSLDSNTYALERNYDHSNHVLVYDASDKLLTDIKLDGGFLCLMEEKGNITVLTDIYDRVTKKSAIYASTYTKSGELLERKDISDKAEQINYYGVFRRGIANSGGYFLVTEDFDEKRVIVYDKDWRLRGSFGYTSNNSYAFVDNCGVTRKTEYDVQWGAADITLRFHLGDYEVVPIKGKLGDANLDDTVDVADATAIQRYDVMMTALSEFALKLSDVDRSGDVDVIDVTCLQRWIASMPAAEGIGQPPV